MYIYYHKFIISIYSSMFILQGVLLHPDGEVRPAGAERRDQEPGRPEGCSRLRALQGAQPPLQPKQPH